MERCVIRTLPAASDDSPEPVQTMNDENEKDYLWRGG